MHSFFFFNSFGVSLRPVPPSFETPGRRRRRNNIVTPRNPRRRLKREVAGNATILADLAESLSSATAPLSSPPDCSTVVARRRDRRDEDYDDEDYDDDDYGDEDRALDNDGSCDRTKRVEECGSRCRRQIFRRVRPPSRGARTRNACEDGGDRRDR